VSAFIMQCRRAACLAALGLVAVTSAGCAVGAYDDGPYYPGGAYDDYPPDAYIATTDPVYFDGHASYWYGDRWYYRDGARWNYYHTEPAELARHRASGPPARRTYEHYQGHVAAHFSGGGHVGGGGHGHR
jgi:hypothetical protein